MQIEGPATVLVPLDFSEFSLNAVEKVLALASEQTEVHVLHVVDPTPAIISMDPALPVPPSVDQSRFDDAMKAMRERFDDPRYSHVHVFCKMGDPGRMIADHAHQSKVTLIVMPSHGRTGLTRLMIGSVTERVLRLAECPVLVLRESRQADESSESA